MEKLIIESFITIVNTVIIIFTVGRSASLKRFLKFLILFPFRLMLLIALLAAYLISYPIRGLFRKPTLSLADVLTMTYPFPVYPFPKLPLNNPIQKWSKGMPRFPKDLPIEKQTEPVYGWKAIKVEYRRPFWDLISIHTSQSFEPVKAIAECNGHVKTIAKCVNGSDEIPDPHCSCGWYSYKNHRSVVDNYLWMARCRYYGKVIKYTEGYRAEKQDVVELWEPENPNESPLNSYEREQLQEQFPTIKFHWFHKGRPSPIADQVNTVQPVQINFPGGDPYDIIAKEFFEYVQPNQILRIPAYTNNAGASMQIRSQIINNSVRIEFLDCNNTCMGIVHLTGTKYWWKENK